MTTHSVIINFDCFDFNSNDRFTSEIGQIDDNGQDYRLGLPPLIQWTMSV